MTPIDKIDGDNQADLAPKITTRLTANERAAQYRKEAYAKAKARQKQYLSSPEVQAKLSARKDQARKLRQEKSSAQRDARRASTKSAKQELSRAAKDSRFQKQVLRDDELKALIKPALTLLKGGVD